MIAADLHIARAPGDDQGAAGDIDDAGPHVAEEGMLAARHAKIDRAAQNIQNASGRRAPVAQDDGLGG